MATVLSPDAGGSMTWRGLLVACGATILLSIVQSTATVPKGRVSNAAPAESQLEGKLEGPFKWLLHLGQNPTDGFRTQYPPYPSKELESYMGVPFMPHPGQVYDFDFEENPFLPVGTSKMMIWTPQYSPSGVFGENASEGPLSQLYHIYVFSPEQRQARFWFRAPQYGLTAWNEGHRLVDGRGSPADAEGQEDFLLRKGVNSMTFAVVLWNADSRFSARITDCNDQEFPDLTFSLTPPLPSGVTYVCRDLPTSYRPRATLDVSLSVRIDPNDEGTHLAVIEYIPEGATVADQGTGNLIGNTLRWSLTAKEANQVNLAYSLKVPADKTGPMAFRGYLYLSKSLQEIIGENVLLEEEPTSASDMAGTIQTIEIDPLKYSAGENVAIGHLDDRPYYLVTGLRGNYGGGWAEYGFTVVHPGEYQVLLDYGEFWTMFHQYADISVSIDSIATLQTSLFPTTHSYPPGFNNFEVERYWLDPERKAKWVVGSVHLDTGFHLLRITFPPMYVANPPATCWDDGRPVIDRITLTNYPGLTVPHLADPHHLDSYEHAPAMLARDREIQGLSDGRVEMTFHSTFYSLSQGDEIYFLDGQVRPRVSESETKFEIVSMEPEWFCIAPNGEQEFTLTARSKGPVPKGYSELIMVWLQGVPDAPSRRLHLFSTCRDYVDLPAFRQREFPWDYKPLFDLVYYMSRGFSRDITDRADMFIPDHDDLGLDKGRYERDLAQFFQDQLREGKLPSIQQMLLENGWDYANLGNNSWGLWSKMLSTLYWRNNLEQSEAYVKRLSENMVFYPVKTRWDWSRPISLPDVLSDVEGIAALAAHVRTAQENLINDEEQFRILHNLVLPIFTSYYDALRVFGVLTEDAKKGATDLKISRPFYGPTGSPVDGMAEGMSYAKLGDDLYGQPGPAGTDVLRFPNPLTKDYPKGTLVAPWNFPEDIDLEGTYLMSLLAIGAASRDSAVIDEILHIYAEILEKEKIFFADGSFRNEPGSYGNDACVYPESVLKVEHLFGPQALNVVSPGVLDRLHKYILNAYNFAFSNSAVPHLNNGGCMNQLGRYVTIEMLQWLFPDDRANIDFYSRLFEQERNRVPGDVIDNVNFVVHGWGYAMLRGEGPWDRRMETLLSSKHLLSDPGDHVSRDCLGLVVYGLGTILTPRYGYSWVSYLSPFLNQVMIDEKWKNYDNAYYGSFWHFDGRKELPSAVAHVGDGNDCSKLDYDMSRWCIQFPEYLFDAYFVQAKDPNVHQYDWSLINMGELEVVEPAGLSWQDGSSFLTGYWPQPGTAGAGSRSLAAKGPGRVIADWHISNGPWVPYGDPTLLRYTPVHSGRLRLIAADDGPSNLINAQIGYYDQPDRFQANSQDILVVRKLASSHAFVDTLEPIADDEQAHVKDVTVVAKGNHQQQLVKVTTAEGEDWVYVSARWGARPDGDTPVPGMKTDADIVAWRTKNGVVTRFYLANGSYAMTPEGSWQFDSLGNHYVAR